MDSTVKPALVLMSGRSAAMAATFLLPVVLARVFDPAGFGTYKQLFLVSLVLYQVGVIFSETLFYFLPRSPERAGQYVANSVLALTAAGSAFLVLLWAGGPAIGRWLGNPDLARYLPLMGAYLVLTLPAASLEMVMVARKRYRWASWCFAASDVARALVMVALAVIVRRLDWVLVGAIACAAARLGAALLYFRAEFHDALRPRAALFREQLVYVLPFAVAVVMDLLQANYHSYAVSHRFDPATFAVYAVGCFQIPLLELVASPMCNVMMVRMTEGLREGRGGDAVPIWAGTARVLALVFFPAAAVLAACAPDLIVLLFTERYRASVPIFMIWSLSVALSAFQTDGVLRVYAATRFLLALSAVRLVLTAALIGSALALGGLRGAVVVTIAVAAVAKGAALVRIAGLMGVSMGRLLPWRDLAAIAGIAAAAAVPAVLLRSALQVPPFVGLALSGLMYAVAYAALLALSGLLRETEKRALVGWLQRWPAPRQAAEIGG